MPGAFVYPYALVLRAKNSAGTIQAQFYAGSFFRGGAGAQSTGTAALVSSGVYYFIAPTILGPPTYEKVELPREGYDWSHYPLTVGWRPRLHVEWIQRTTEILGLDPVGLGNPPGGTQFLRNVIAYLTTVGDYLELALDGWLATPNFRRVNLVSDVFDYKNVDGKDIGVLLALDFEGATLISAPPALDATSWGTAT